MPPTANLAIRDGDTGGLASSRTKLETLLGPNLALPRLAGRPNVTRIPWLHGKPCPVCAAVVPRYTKRHGGGRRKTYCSDLCR